MVISVFGNIFKGTANGSNSYDRSPYHIETNPLISSACQWTGFYMIGTSVMKELILLALQFRKHFRLYLHQVVNLSFNSFMTVVPRD